MILDFLITFGGWLKIAANDAWVFGTTHMLTLLGLLLGFVVMQKLIRERRRPGNIFAWVLVIVFIPWLGIALFFLFGGRKYQRLTRNKRRIRELAESLARQQSEPPFSAHTMRFPEISGNAFQLLPDGVAAYEALLQEIQAAKHSIRMTSYILGDDATGREIVQQLAAKAKAGVEVYLLLDAIGSRGQLGRFVDPLRKAGGHVARFMPMLPLRSRASFNLRNHRKVFLFDDQRAILGGQNLDARFLRPEASPECFTDFSASVNGPVAGWLLRDFVSDWCFATGEPVHAWQKQLTLRTTSQGPVTLQVVPSGPDMRRDYLWERLVSLIQEVREELVLVTPYFLPDEVTLQSLIIKAHAGKRVQLIVPEQSNQRLVDLARAHYLRLLHAEGVEVLLHRGPVLHGKLLLADHQLAVMGSANLDNRSLFLNYETALLSRSLGAVQPLESWIRKLRDHCQPFGMSRQAAPPKRRLFLEDFAHLIEPLL